VRDVEEARALAHRGVLLEDARVLDGHVPAREIHDAGACADVGLEERCALGHGERRY
jgi:hypothetical protein